MPKKLPFGKEILAPSVFQSYILYFEVFNKSLTPNFIILALDKYISCPHSRKKNSSCLQAQLMNAVILCLRQPYIIGILSSNRFYFSLFGSKRGNITNKKRNFYNNLFCPFLPPKKIFFIIGDCFKHIVRPFVKTYQKI